MKLSKALKEKNKLIKEIDVYFKRAASNNSVIEGGKSDYSSKDQIEKGLEKIEELVALKAKIQAANQPVQDKIFRLSELKSLILRLRHIPTTDGPQAPSYRSEVAVSYNAEIKKIDIDQMIEKYEKEIETIQEELDAFNHTTDI